MIGKKYLIIDESTLEAVEKRLISIKSIIVLFVSIFIINLTLLFIVSSREVIYVSGEKSITIVSHDRFSKEELKAYIDKLNIRFPDIVYKQAILETNNFQSSIFIENNNLFGMKIAINRPTTSIGVNKNHAVYENWRQSVIDYALFQTSYARNITNEEDYYNFLKNYAEDSLYVYKLKQIKSK